MQIDVNPKFYKLKSGRYQVSYFNSVSRKRVRRKFQSLAEAQGFEEDLKVKFLHHSKYSSGDTVQVWMKRYLELSPKAFIVRQGKPMYQSFIKSFGHIPVMSITEEVLVEWLKDFQIERSYSVKTMPNIKSAINQFFQFIVDSKALAVNPMVKVTKLDGLPSKSRVVLTQDELSKLLEKVKATSPELIYPVVFLLAHTGARLGEILNLKWIDVHFELSAIQLLWTKNGEDRLIQISDEVLSFLKARSQLNEYVVLSQYQKPWSHSIYRKQFNKFRQKIGFHKYWCNHVLRHSFATNYLLAGGDMLQLQKILGHKTLTMTVDLYGQIEAKAVFNTSPFNF